MPHRGTPSALASRSLVIFAFVSVSIVWGATYLGIRIALESFPPFFLGASRCLIAGALLLAFLRARGAEMPSLVGWASATVTGGLYFVVGNGLVNLAEKRVSSGLVSVLVATMPLWATLYERLAGAEVRAREWLGIGLGLTGVVLLNLGGELRASGPSAAYALIAPMGWALGTVVSRRLPLPKGATSTAAQMLGGGVLMTLVGLARGEHLQGPPTAAATMALAALALFGSLGGFSAYAYLVRHTRTTVATSYAYINPVVAVALGLIFAGETIDLASALGAATILSAVIILTRGKARAPTPPRETPEPLPTTAVE
ncbi:MAG TPA: drug/metabolite exporter YedA [Polyangiaceae bacterium]|jgi:drug/metabolite transporter (DMT)-like permease